MKKPEIANRVQEKTEQKCKENVNRENGKERSQRRKVEREKN